MSSAYRVTQCALNLALNLSQRVVWRIAWRVTQRIASRVAQRIAQRARPQPAAASETVARAIHDRRIEATRAANERLV